mgnify:CR=1 FL=1
MKKGMLAAAICLMLCACQTPEEGSVVNKVLSDFGLREKPEGYVSGADKAFPTLNTIAPDEMARLNLEERQGTIEFQEESSLKGKFYKRVKVYEDYYPLEVTHAGGQDRGFTGYIDYKYRIYESERKDTRVEAANEVATIPTDETGRETYRYSLSHSGDWNGEKGERTKNK